ncbi:hypothetical protein [Salinarimonas sp.]|uniref:hypothetical protein n=1 Tax=Salinarimonas sp. TaxID=2766526 RepID=UPI003919C9D0
MEAADESDGVRVGEGYASVVGSLGVQHLALSLARGRERFAAIASVVEGVGIDHLEIVRFARVRAQSEALDEFRERTGTFAVPGAFVLRRLGQALADGRRSPPDLLVLEALLGTPIVPTQWATEEAIAPVLATLRGDRSRATLDALREHVATPEGARWLTWRESDPDVLDAAVRRGDADAIMADVAHAIDRDRERWARLCAIAAATSDASTAGFGKPPALPFALAARDLLAGRSILDIPVMRVVAENTVRTARPPLRRPKRPRRETVRIEGAVEPGDPALLRRQLERAGLGEAWLDGYLVALAAAPRLPAPDRWLNPLVARLRPENREGVVAIVEAVLARATLLDETCADAAALRRLLGGYDGAALDAFGRGFAALAEAIPSAFAAKSFGDAGRRMLRTLAAGNAGGAVEAVRPLLPAWIAGLRAARRTDAA